MNHHDSFCAFVKAQPLSDDLKHQLILRMSLAMNDAFTRGQAAPDSRAYARIKAREDAALSRRQILLVLKEKGWTRARGLFFKERGPGRHGVDLRAAASLEMLTSKDSLDMPRRRKRTSQPMDASCGMSGMQMGN